MSVQGGLGASLVVLCLLLGGCGDEAASKSGDGASGDSERGSRPYTGYPDSMVVLAHSGATGEGSEGTPGVEVRENSWATGTNPAVNSVYQRLLELNPAIEGNAENLARGGATVEDLVSQAHEAVRLDPRPQLVLIQIMDNDIVCPASTEDYDTFGSTFESALDVLTEGLPQARFLVVSQFGSPSTYWKALTPDQRRQFGETGLCAFIEPNGDLDQRELARFETTIRVYESKLAECCQKVEHCAYDDGAFGSVEDKAEYLASDLNHLSVAGHAKAAEVAWTSVLSAGLAPAED